MGVRLFLAAAAIVLAAVLAWMLFADVGRGPAGPIDLRQGTTSAAVTDVDADLADVASSEASGRRSVAAQRPADPAPEVPRPSSAQRLPPPILTGRVVDKRTGEPVPMVEILRDLRSPRPMPSKWGTLEARTPRPAQQGPPRPPQGLDFVGHSGDDGTFFLRGVGDAVSVEATFLDRDRQHPRKGQRIVLASPEAGDVPVDVGPTFSFELDGVALTEGDYVVLTGTMHGVGCTLQSAVRMVPRADGRPWVRFDPIVTGFDGGGPWTAIYHSGRTRRIGSVTIPTRIGVHPEPLLVEWLALGAARFSFHPPPATEAVPPVRRMGAHIERISEGGGQRAPRPLQRSLPGRTRADVWLTTRGAHLVATADKLLPGRYRWTIGGGAHVRSGTFRVVAHETTEVSLESVELPTFDAVVTVRSGALEGDVFPPPVLTATNVDGRHGYVSAALRPDGDGVWRATFAALPMGRWSVLGPRDLGYEAAPLAAPLSPDRTSAEFVLSARGPTRAIRIRVRDRVTGNDVFSARAQSVDGMAAHPLMRDGEAFVHPGVPVAGAVDIVVGATEYKTQQIHLDAAQVADEIVVELERGERARVQVVEATSGEPVAEVALRTAGGVVATTDAAGVAWIDGPVLGEILEVATDGTDWIEVGSSFRGEQRPWTPAGWLFQVARSDG